MPYMPFPPTWPVYIPKDMLANWFESYVDAMELNFWTGTELTGGSYDDAHRQWNVTLRRVGRQRARACTRAISSSRPASAAFPITPDLPGLDSFAGTDRAFRRLQERRAMEGPQGAGAGHRHQRPRRRAGTARARRRRHHHPAQQDLCRQPERGAERLRDLFRRHPLRGLRPAGDLVSLSGAAALLSVLDRAGPRGRQGAARRAREMRLPACTSAKTRPASR